ncbi:helix-turn-helix domain-containing protein [Photobacterium sp. DNB23_23_1]|uniref:Helix-turn-helix transcriptional regulator n=1 Tax=Photobacterium pectinilyticum TaxID=2906793 RepID=A0ABT1N0I8_9GAMM|nr:helix-turn-helix transcriptional regulator [Photobacterium sp. ZSDE20]MCQ1058052.1 helix-turn-helix transcriptional regulator [Photobacterium sp. ZSDE20]MDD1822585.1 helix-turn-helix transcriptional regulator [Photobacterium sp. ZSDE20]
MISGKDPIVPLIKSGYARLIVEIFYEYNHDPHKVIKDSGLPPDLFDLDQEFLPQEPMKKLIYLLANQLGLTQFGEILRTAIRRKAIPRLIGEFADCKTVKDALELTQTVFQHDSTVVNVGLESSHGRTWYWCKRRADESAHFLWSEVWAVLYAVEFIRVLTHSDWLPSQIKIQSNDSDIYSSILGNSIQYFVGNERIEWLIDDDVLAQQLRITAKDSEAKAPLIRWHANFTDRVFTSLLPYVRERNLTLEEAAELLSMSPRTLQRRLTEERTSFRRLKDNLLYTVAVDMMAEDLSLTHIASQLGYSNIAHFSRSFKRISGLTPKVYQKVILSLDRDP